MAVIGIIFLLKTSYPLKLLSLRALAPTTLLPTRLRCVLLLDPLGRVRLSPMHWSLLLDHRFHWRHYAEGLGAPRVRLHRRFLREEARGFEDAEFLSLIITKPRNLLRHHRILQRIYRLRLIYLPLKLHQFLRFLLYQWRRHDNRAIFVAIMKFICVILRNDVLECGVI